MAVSFLPLILVGLFALGILGAFVALFVLAIAKGRGGAAILAGGLAFIGLLIGAAFLFMLLGYSQVRMERPATTHYESVSKGPIYWGNRDAPTPLTVTSDSAAWSAVLLLVLLAGLAIVGALLFTARRSPGHAATGHNRVLQVVAGLLLLAFLFNRWLNMPPKIRVATESKYSIGMDNSMTAKRTQAASLAEHTDIHKMLDAYDAPRIAIQTSTTPPTSSAELVATATHPPTHATTKVATEANESKSIVAKTTKPQAASLKRSVAKAATAAADTQSDRKSIIEVAAAEVAAPAPARPTWVDSLPVRTRDLRREVIVTEEYESTGECLRAADVYLLLKAYDRLQQLRGQPYPAQNLPSIAFVNNSMLADGKVIYGTKDSTGSSGWCDNRLALLNRMGITPEFLRSEIVSKDPMTDELHEFIETSNRTFGPMKRLHTQIEFTPAVDRELMSRWDAQLREDRFAYVGLGAGSVLGLLGMAWGLLKLDTATKGYYSKWLFIGVPATIIGAMLFSLLAFTA